MATSPVPRDPRNTALERRAARWVVNDRAMAKRCCRHVRERVGWDPLRPATWRRLTPPLLRAQQPGWRAETP